MLLPENPEKRQVLWDAVARQLAGTAMCFVIEDGAGDPFAQATRLNQDEAELVLTRLRRAHICRVSANRGNAISPHFAGRREDDTVLVTDLLSSPSAAELTVRKEKLKCDLETAVINLFFTESGVNTVFVPLPLEPWAMQDTEITLVEEGLIFRKRR